jgi:hypothetical protein
MNPLPLGADLDYSQKTDPHANIGQFLRSNLQWGDPLKDGALRAGAIHTMEFASELFAVLSEPEAMSAFIEALSFSVLGASGASAVSFDEGRTIFSVEIADGQVWRIRKTRLGRIAVLWNKAKHVVVYERSVVPSLQFQGQQPDERTFGWPILRKTEEYVEPIEMFRVFETEPDSGGNSVGFAHGSEFITARIYVDGAWGRDLETKGYEIPLWNPADRWWRLVDTPGAENTRAFGTNALRSCTSIRTPKRARARTLISGRPFTVWTFLRQGRRAGQFRPTWT